MKDVDVMRDELVKLGASKAAIGKADELLKAMKDSEKARDGV